MDKINIPARKRSRKLLVQALYQWHFTKEELTEIEAQFLVINQAKNIDKEYFHKLLYGVFENLAKLEEQFIPLLDRDLKSINPVELTILRISTYELLFCIEIPYRIIIEEAISLAKIYGAEQGYRYVNGILHDVAKQNRKLEMGS